jgi:acyl transferase domain-containing protein
MHLRNLNPYVATAMSDWARARAGAGVRALRQVAPAILASGTGSADSSGLGQLAGSSSFGMSGVNAHMILSKPGSLSAIKPQVCVPKRMHMTGQPSSPSGYTHAACQNVFFCLCDRLVC